MAAISRLLAALQKNGPRFFNQGSDILKNQTNPWSLNPS